MGRLGISMDDILKEIERLDNQQPEGFSIADMAKATGHCKDWCRERVRELIDEGKMRPNGQAVRTDIAGRKCRVFVYTMLE